MKRITHISLKKGLPLELFFLILFYLSYKKNGFNANKIKGISLQDGIFTTGQITSEKKAKRLVYNNNHDTFHRAFGKLLAVGQFFGILPVIGVLDPDPSHLKYTWISWRVGYTLICISGSTIMTASCLFRLFFTGVNIYKSINTMFYGSTLMVFILFWRLAPHWPALVAAITKEERPRKSPKRTLRHRFSSFSFGILFPALVEHLLAVITCISIARDCNQGDPIANTYFISSFPQIFMHTEYDHFKGLLIQFVNVSSTFSWNFMDLFVILMSLTLTDRFDQLNERLENIKGKNTPEQFWKEARDEYVYLSHLVKKTDKYINAIVFLSFTNNIYFICLQLFNSLKVAVRKGCICSPFRRVVRAVYFMFSFGFLVTRSLSVSLGAAKVHASSRLPTAVIYAAPSQTYGIEQRRFLEQVINDVIALTGLNVFFITRGLVLTIAGTIVTYELVLVQFNPSSEEPNVNITSTDICGVTIESLLD